MRKLLQRRFIKFCISGLINSGLSYSIYALLLILDCNYLFATTISCIGGVLFGYSINSLFIFQQKLCYRTLLKYSLAYIISYFINLLLMFILVTLLKINEYSAPILCMGIMAGINYYLVKNFALKELSK